MTTYEIREEIERVCKKKYCCEKKTVDKKKKMLLVSHTLQRGGAPLVLLDLIPFFQKSYDIVFVACEDGELAKDFLEVGLDVYVAYMFDFAKVRYDIWRSFDLVLLNTIMTYAFVPLFMNLNIPVLWWFHEPEMLIKKMYGLFLPLSLLSDNFIPLAITDDTADFIEKYYEIRPQVLHMSILDCHEVVDRKKGERVIRFFMPAKFQSIKGQDILAQAIIMLDESYRSRAEFIFAGNYDEYEPEWFRLIEKLQIAFPDSVKMLGSLDKKEVYKWYRMVDVVVAPSRMDATPTTIVEAMMFEKLCVCSDATGISRYMHNGIDGFIFESGNVTELKDILEYIIDHFSEMEDICDAGRRIYLKHFSPEVIEEQIQNILALV